MKTSVHPVPAFSPGDNGVEQRQGTMSDAQVSATTSMQIVRKMGR